ncbi:hypothetical protein SDC9_66436 [bioreactor metagenome]|uniref:Uncharacterized protein n=1 Tax=bioreactor metagenome TaxID=1076179 RepID=A0A644XV95_9ZZZZ
MHILAEHELAGRENHAEYENGSNKPPITETASQNADQLVVCLYLGEEKGCTEKQ